MGLRQFQAFASSHTWCRSTLALRHNWIVATGCCGPATAHLFSVTAFPRGQCTERCFENVRNGNAYTLRACSPALEVQEIGLVLEKIYGKRWEEKEGTNRPEI